MLLNQARAAALMGEHDVAAIVATSPENVQYLTGHMGWGRRVYREAESYGVVLREPRWGLGLVADNSMESAYLAQDGTVAGTVATYGAKAPVWIPDGFEPTTDIEREYVAFQDEAKILRDGPEALIHVLRSMGLVRGRVAVDETSCSDVLLARLRAEFPGCEFILGGAGLLQLIRLVKTDEEIGLLRTAAEINEAARSALYAGLRPGGTEIEAVRAWHETVARSGGSWQWMHFASGSRAADIFPPNGRVLQIGDRFTYDSGLTYRGYYADCGGCGILGEPEPRMVRDFQAIATGMEQTLDTIRAGVTGGQLYATLVKSIREAGLPKFEGSFAGHTVGLQPREFPNMFTPEKCYHEPFLPESSELPIPANATIILEAPFAVMGHVRYQYEITVLVKSDGWEPLIPGQDTGMKVIPV